MKRPRIKKDHVASSSSATVNKVYTKKLAESLGITEEHLKDLYNVQREAKNHNYNGPKPKGYTVNVTMLEGTSTFFVTYDVWHERKASFEGMSITIKPVW